MANKKVFVETDDKGRKIHWKEVASNRIACTIKKGSKVYICKNSNRYNLIFDYKEVKQYGLR